MFGDQLEPIGSFYTHTGTRLDAGTLVAFLTEHPDSLF